MNDDDPNEIEEPLPPPFYPPSGQKALEWMAVLKAASIQVTADRDDTGQLILLVYESDHRRADQQITEFEEECRHWPPPDELPRSDHPPSLASLLAGVIIFYAFMFTGPADANGPMIIAGRMDSEAVLGGEWWRVFTALMLHADIQHVAGNICIGVIFASMLSHSIGSGSAWLLIVLGGGIGNALNAVFQRADHLSVGASTGVFAILGIMGGLRAYEHGVLRNFRLTGVWMPLLAILALLSLFGGGDDPRTDLSAHLFGLLAGVVLGLLARPLDLHIAKPKRQQHYLAFAAAIMIGAWLVAVYGQ
jgi:membrane associated rhomboid family serine protease